MTAPNASFVRLTMGGTISASQTWSTGISVAAQDNQLTQGQLDGLLTAWRTAVLANLWSTTGTTLRTFNAGAVDLRSFRAYWYPFGAPPVGLQAAQDITPIAGNGSGPLPPQCALVATLLTGIPGRKYRGRMYFPLTAATLGADLQMSAANLTTLTAALKATLDAVNVYTTASGPGDVAVAGSAGTIPINSIRIDSEVDTQRRRTDKLLALRTASATLA